MKVSISWLKDYIPIEMDVYRLADALTMAGLEVEAVTDRYDYLESVFVGRIIEVTPHPNADKLKLCNVDIGDRIITVVCGAPNACNNLLAPVALPGTRLSDGSILEKGTIRGEISEGMLCSEVELGLGQASSGIMILDQSLITGDQLATALKLSDMVLEIDLTPNRPDCLSIIGIAREIAAIRNTGIKYPEKKLPGSKDDISDSQYKGTGEFDNILGRKPGKNNISGLTSVTIKAPDHCPRYAARLLEKVIVAPSPFWIQDRLMSVGLKPINNIVDITNFVMMETGQPLHAFDFDLLEENRIVVRTAKEGEKFTTLDRKEHTLSGDMLMICDGQRPVAIGGVMGGLNSEIEQSTTRVLLESAYFSPVSIRKTSKKLGLKTDASHRFERGVDPDGTITALNRAVYLLDSIGIDGLFDGIIDEHPGTITEKTITLSTKETNRILGTSLSRNKIEALLKSIEFKVAKDNTKDKIDKLIVIPPSFRVDIERSIDLMEEVARLSGYNNIQTTFPLIPAEARPLSKKMDMRNRIKRLMTGFGFTETISYSFVSEQSCDRLRLPENDLKRKMLYILNPLTEDQAVMRTSLIPGLLETMHRNNSQHVINLKLFETGNLFISMGQDKLPEEKEFLVGLWTGTRSDATWHLSETDCDFYDIKGGVEGLLNRLDVNDIIFTMMPNALISYTKSGHTAQIFSGKKFIGLVGEVAPHVLRNYDLKQTAFIFELNLDTLIHLIPDIRYSKPIPKFPSISRDITIIIDKSIESKNILESVKDVNEELVEKIHLFDVFKGNPIPQGKKSLSFRIIYRSSKETLKDDKVNQIHKNITERVVKKFNATLPA